MVEDVQAERQNAVGRTPEGFNVGELGTQRL